MSNNLIRTYIIIVLWVGYVNHSIAQTAGDVERLSFKIEDAATRQPLRHVTCRAFTKENKFYNYAISENNGNLTITANKSDLLEFSCIGYEAVKAPANSFTSQKRNSIKLAQKAVEFQEIILNAPPNRAKHDTIAYNAGSFAKPGDVYLEDVLRKLPGIKVADNGSVSYQGKAINKFYIEGKDLLGNSYNQATKNLPIEAVTTIEVLENHQPVKMLKGQQISDKAALNIKIDKGHKLRPFGELRAGVGGSPAIWDNRIFLTQLMGNSQMLITGKMNNTGDDISSETIEHIDIADLDAYEPLSSPLLTTSPITETLPQNRYLHNKSYSSGINYLMGISAESTLRFNVLFYKDHSSYKNLSENIYGGETPVALAETASKAQQTITVLPIIKYELNSSKAFISNELKYSFNHTTTPNTINSNGIWLSENIDNRPTYLQNYFTSAFTFGKRIVQAKSFLRYFSRKEMLNSMSDTLSFYDVSERFATKSFTLKTIISSSLPLYGNSLDLTSEVYYQNNNYEYNGRAKHDKLRIKFSLDYTINLGTNRSLSLDIPFEWFHIKHSFHSRDHITLVPRLDFRYQFTDKWKVAVSASYSTDNSTPDFYSPYILRTGYRTEYTSNDEIFFNSVKLASVRFAYRNLATMLFSNFSFSYSDSDRESYINYTYTDSITKKTILPGKNHSRMFVINGSLDKSFTDAGIALESDINFTQAKYLISQSGLNLNNRSNIFNADFNLIFQKLRWLRISVGANGTLYWERNSIYHSDLIKTLVVNVSLFIFPTKAVDINLKYQNHINEISASKYKSCGIFDLHANYKITKRWEIGASISNILDTKSYTITQDSGINTFYSSLPLRGREFLFHAILRI